jgi:hypothetical protein
MPIGQANQVGKTDDGLTMRKLTAHVADLPERLIIVDGRFVLFDLAREDDDENGVCRKEVRQTVATIS